MASAASHTDPAEAAVLDVGAIRAQFPVLRQEVRGHRLVYLDNAATTHMPRPVLDAVQAFLEHDRANIHRGVHTLSGRATAAYEAARARVARFLGAPAEEFIFVRGTTEAINLVARSWGDAHLGAGDEILITELEHHSNIVPWQLLAQRTGARVRALPIDARGALQLDALEALVGPRTRLVALAHVSNALGTHNPVAEICARVRARAPSARILVDGAQAVPHQRVDVGALGCDFYAFSGHKLYGPFGIGGLWVRGEVLADMPPYEGGGGMIREVTLEGTTYAPGPERFEAGTPNVSGAVGLGAAVQWLDALGIDAVAAHEARVLGALEAALDEVPGLRRVGEAPERAAVCSFVVEGIHPHDLGTILDTHGVAVRAGHHCAQPAMRKLGVPATARASVAVYNGLDDVEALVEALHRARGLFGLAGPGEGR